MVDVKTCCLTICILPNQSIKMIHHITIREKNYIPQLNSDKSKEEDRWVLVENERMSFTPQGLREKHPSKENAPYNLIQFSITIQLSFFAIPPSYLYSTPNHLLVILLLLEYTFITPSSCSLTNSHNSSSQNQVFLVTSELKSPYPGSIQF